MNSPRRLLVFHRNSMFRDCLANFLSSAGEFAAVGVDPASDHCLRDLVTGDPDVVLLDLRLPDDMAPQIARAIRDSAMRTKVILLVPDDHDRLVECVAAGAHGCVLERASLDELREAIEHSLGGRSFCSPEILTTMFSQLSRYPQISAWKAESQTNVRRLTSREQEVLQLMARRRSNKEIASELRVSLFTVKNHVHNILDKLNVENRVQAVDIARRENRLNTSL